MPTEPKRDAVEETNEFYRRQGTPPPPVREFLPKEQPNPIEQFRKSVTGPELAPVGTPGERVPPAYPKESGITPGRGPFGGT